MHKFAIPFEEGEVVEWSITAVLKTVELKGSGGSNPSLSAKHKKISVQASLTLIFLCFATPRRRRAGKPERSDGIPESEGADRKQVEGTETSAHKQHRPLHALRRICFIRTVHDSTYQETAPPEVKSSVLRPSSEGLLGVPAIAASPGQSEIL